MWVTVISAKGSPGASTLALGLALRWRESVAALVEADPAGGDLATRFGRFEQPGLATLALQARRADPTPEVAGSLQLLPCGVPVVLAPTGPAAAASVATLAGQGPRLLRLLTAQQPAVLVDAGRWRPGSPADPLVAASDVVLLVARPGPEEIRHCDARIGQLRELVDDVRLVLVGERGSWPPGEIARALGVAVAQVVPIDRDGAGVLTGAMLPRKGWAAPGWTRLPLLRACHSLARKLARPTTGSAAMPPVRMTQWMNHQGVRQ